MLISPLGGARSIAMSMSVCLSVHSYNSEDYTVDLHQIFMPWLGPPLTAWRYLSTSGFVDDITVFISWGLWAVSSTTLYFNEARQVDVRQLQTLSECGTGGEVCYLRFCLVCLFVRSHNSKTTRPFFANFFVHVTCGDGSVLV